MALATITNTANRSWSNFFCGPWIWNVDKKGRNCSLSTLALPSYSENQKNITPKTVKTCALPSFDFELEFLYEDGQVGLLPGPKPSPVQFPRKPINLKFAVLLMRSSYEACDDLDFVAMNKFQERVLILP